MQGDGSNAALRGAFVGEHAQVGGGEELRHFLVVDVAVEDLDAVGAARSCDLRFVFVETAVAFAGDDQLVTGSEQRHGVDQQVEALVVADQAEEEQRASVGVKPELRLRLRFVHLLSEMVVKRVGLEDVRLVGR